MGVLSGKVVVVTGAGNGIGKECALLAGREGASVVVNDLGGGLKGEDAGSAGPAEEVAKEIRAAGGKAVSNSDSVADYDAVAAMFEGHPHFGIPGASIEVMSASPLPDME